MCICALLVQWVAPEIELFQFGERCQGAQADDPVIIEVKLSQVDEPCQWGQVESG